MDESTSDEDGIVEDLQDQRNATNPIRKIRCPSRKSISKTVISKESSFKKINSNKKILRQKTEKVNENKGFLFMLHSKYLDYLHVMAVTNAKNQLFLF